MWMRYESNRIVYFYSKFRFSFGFIVFDNKIIKNNENVNQTNENLKWKKSMEIMNWVSCVFNKILKSVQAKFYHHMTEMNMSEH